MAGLQLPGGEGSMSDTGELQIRENVEHALMLSRGIRSALSDEQLCDIKLIGNDEIAVPCHRIILSAICPGFVSLLADLTKPLPPPDKPGGQDTPAAPPPPLTIPMAQLSPCLSSVSSADIHFLLDFVYNGVFKPSPPAERLLPTLTMATMFQCQGPLLPSLRSRVSPRIAGSLFMMCIPPDWDGKGDPPVLHHGLQGLLDLVVSIIVGRFGEVMAAEENRQLLGESAMSWILMQDGLHVADEAEVLRVALEWAEIDPPDRGQALTSERLLKSVRFGLLSPDAIRQSFWRLSCIVGVSNIDDKVYKALAAAHEAGGGGGLGSPSKHSKGVTFDSGGERSAADTTKGKTDKKPAGLRTGSEKGVLKTSEAKEGTKGTPHAANQEHEGGGDAGLERQGSIGSQQRGGWEGRGMLVVVGGTRPPKWNSNVLPVNTFSIRMEMNVMLVERRLTPTGGVQASEEVLVFDLQKRVPRAGASNPWLSAASLVDGRQFAGGAMVCGRMYIMGGQVVVGASQGEWKHWNGGGEGRLRAERVASVESVSVERVVAQLLSAQEGGNNSARSYGERGGWSGVRSLPHVRSGLRGACVHSFLYALGGNCGGAGGGSRVQTCLRYDPAPGGRMEWTRIADMSKGRSNMGVAVLDEKLYVIGGFDGIERLKSVEAYDVEEDRWEERGSLMHSREGVACAALGGYIYAVGGFDGFTVLRTVERYDPSRDKWEVLSNLLVVPRAFMGVEAFEGRLYVVGGTDNTGTFLDSVESMQPSTGVGSGPAERDGHAERTDSWVLRNEMRLPVPMSNFVSFLL